MRHLMLVPLVSLSLLFGCATFQQGSIISDKEVADHGTKSFNAPREKVFAAAAASLQSMGFAVAIQNPEKGLIQTDRKLIRVDAARTAPGQAVGITYTRQYVLRFTENGGTTAVSATPRLFENDIEISDKPIWSMQGEQQLWKQLFTDMDTAM
ncbi:hypothetical protein [Archangium sp. Cb G35]|uniref:hypothetical protein n=1 Tax=Archangium sp. Cb G35 TaxID=1920190 RepID=UPI000ABBF881|nr:hypothetical protein [Archangium sp. Cb G35]